MKKSLTILAKFLFLLFVDAVGSLVYHPFHIQTALTGTPIAPRVFIWDGVLLMLLAYLLLLVVDVLRKRLAASAPWTTLALVLAALVGYFLKLGFVTHNW